MSEPVFLTLDEIAEIHIDQIDRYGGSHGIRDAEALASALSQPSATFAGKYLHADLFEMSAAYLYHIAMNHPFFDGNKRAGTVAALLFLDLNGVEFTADPDDLTDFVFRIAQGKTKKDQIAKFLKKHSLRQRRENGRGSI